MKKINIFILCSIMTFCLTGCGNLERNTRDTIAVATGLIQSAQLQYGSECQANPTSGTCVLVNQGVHGQNALITALEAYCGFQIGVTLPDAKCVPVKSAAGALQAALANLKNITGEITAIVQAGKKTAVQERALAIQASILERSREVPTFNDLESIRIGGAL